MFRFIRRSVLPVFLFCSSVLASPALQAQAQLIFGGGNGAPLTLELTAPVSYTVTSDFGANDVAPYFLFENVGNNLLQFNVTGTITFSINSGVPQTFAAVRAGGVTFGDVSSTDYYLFGTRPGVNVGDVITLNAGTLITTTAFADAPPTSGTFQSFIFDNAGQNIGAAVPEPSTWLLLGLGAGAVVIVRLRRRRRA